MQTMEEGAMIPGELAEKDVDSFSRLPVFPMH
jgi:hypothetical protein